LRKETEKATRIPRPRARSKQKSAAPQGDGLERIQKIIAAGGVTSRRKAEELITQGRVVINGQVVTELGAKANPLSDRIEVDGRKITSGGQPKAYILLNKPKGVISSVSDEHNRPVVTDIVRVKVRVYPVGRLDYDAEGVILHKRRRPLEQAYSSDIHGRQDIPGKGQGRADEGKAPEA
jgi:23S rRNA-/tRNA-specific pseudouridylate synthase